MVPPTLLLTPDGRKMVKFIGFVGEYELANILDAHLYRWRKDEASSENFGASGEVLSA